MSPSLLMRPIPVKGESAAGFLVRAAELNACNSVYEIFNSAGLYMNEPKLRACLLERSRFGALMMVLGMPVKYAALVPLRVGGTRFGARRHEAASIPDGLFHKDLLNHYCPVCLAETPLWSQHWLIKPFSACTKHGVLLLTGCSGCGAVLGIGRNLVAQCDKCCRELIRFNVQSIDVTAQKAVEDMLAKKSCSRLAKILELWRCLSRFDAAGDDPWSNHARLKLAVLCIESPLKGASQIAEVAILRAERVHPRIQLLPLLERQKDFSLLLKMVQNKIPSVSAVGSGHPGFKSFSKKEVCIILSITPSQLAKATRLRLIRWPEGHSREARLPAAEVEKALLTGLLNYE